MMLKSTHRCPAMRFQAALPTVYWFRPFLAVLRFASTVGAFGCLVSAAPADLVVASSAPPGNPLVVATGATSAPLLLSVVDDGASDNLLGWQLNLLLIPDAGTVGTLSFQSATLPASNYVFDGMSAFGLNIQLSATTSADDTLLAFDFASQAGGVDVPSAPGAGLLEVQLQASSNAQGTFGLYVSGGPGFTEWTDAEVAAREFDNIAGSGLTRIADVSAVPEPALLYLAAMMTVLLAIAARPVFGICRSR